MQYVIIMLLVFKFSVIGQNCSLLRGTLEEHEAQVGGLRAEQ